MVFLRRFYLSHSKSFLFQIISVAQRNRAFHGVKSRFDPFLLMMPRISTIGRGKIHLVHEIQ